MIYIVSPEMARDLIEREISTTDGINDIKAILVNDSDFGRIRYVKGERLISETKLDYGLLQSIEDEPEVFIKGEINSLIKLVNP